MSNKNCYCVDLFCGAGGLSKGLFILDTKYKELHRFENSTNVLSTISE